MRFKTIVLVAVILLCSQFLFSNTVDRDTNRRSADPAAYRVVVPPVEKPPKIDGKLDDPFWETGAVLENFTQFEPLEGSEPTERTVAYMGYDANNLYIAVRCYDSNPKAVRACLTQRDKVYGDDEVTIFLDTFNDKKRAFAFLVNPCGVQSDGIYVESSGGRRGRGRGGGGGGPDRIDKTWDTYFTTDANMDDEGYTVEIAIPFKSLRFPHSQQQLWGMQIKRNIRRKNEEIYWYPRSRDINGFLIQAGTIQIDGSLNKGKNFEVMPVVTGLKEQSQKADPQAGLNLKYGITSDLTADATVNPDFSQVEADMPQIDVNQRYALYYPEKRPFFLEGKDFFDTPLELIYTRNIVDPGWGIKLTGKMGKTTMGFLSTYDLNPTGIKNPGDDEDDDEEEEEDITQRGLVTVFRLKRDLFSESYIGFIFADKEIGQSWDTITTDYNRVGGVDGHFKFWDNYRFSFQVVGSQTKVEDYKSELVPAAKFNFSARGRHLSFSADYSHIPDDFEASSGFFRRKDVKSFNSRLSYAFLPMNDLIVDIRPSLQYRRIYDFDNVLTDEEYQLSFFMSGWRGTFISAGLSRNFERYEGVNFWRNNFRTWIRSEPLSWLTGGINFSLGESIYYGDDPYLGYKYSYGFNLTFKPITNLRLFYNVRNDTFYKSRGGELEYKVNIFTQRISYQITRYLSLRLITDYNDYNKEIYNSILLSYQLNPGSVFYVGIDDNQEQDDLGIYRIEGRYFFVKFSYWWRI
jgi:hypothetical protein